MRLIIVRHGQSEENFAKTLQGILPGKLSPTGILQSQKLGQYLTKEKIDVIYCSPLNRCTQTLDWVKKSLDPSIPTYVSPLIIERDFGQLSGKPHSEIDFSTIDQDTPKNRQLGIESITHLMQKIQQFLQDINSKHPKETVLVITHHNPIRLIFAQLLNKTFQEILTDYKISNASISIFEVGDSVVPITLNQTDFHSL